jgi:hypothetical protein
MELKVDISFEQLTQAIKQLPEAKIMQLKAELSGTGFVENHAERIADFQNLLLEGPVMDDKQYEGHKNLRNRFIKWRTK